MNLKVLTIDDDTNFLSRVSKTADYYDIDTLNDSEILCNYAKQNNYQYLSAIQIGIQKRIIYFKSKIIINPLIIKKEGSIPVWTTCISCPNYTSLVKRPNIIMVEYLDIYGNTIYDVFNGIDAINFMHLYDHLNGYLPIDIVLNTQNNYLKRLTKK